jgi:hypothetical protein
MVAVVNALEPCATVCYYFVTSFVSFIVDVNISLICVHYDIGIGSVCGFLCQLLSGCD